MSVWSEPVTSHACDKSHDKKGRKKWSVFNKISFSDVWLVIEAVTSVKGVNQSAVQTLKFHHFYGLSFELELKKDHAQIRCFIFYFIFFWKALTQLPMTTESIIELDTSALKGNDCLSEQSILKFSVRMWRKIFAHTKAAETRQNRIKGLVAFNPSDYWG